MNRAYLSYQSLQVYHGSIQAWIPPFEIGTLSIRVCCLDEGELHRTSSLLGVDQGGTVPFFCTLLLHPLFRL